jgi:iron complex outermembrane receptor protein
VSWSSLPVTLAEIRQIEVVRGSNSALFGFNAVGGVINIITFNPTYDNINSIEAHGGTQNDFGASVVQTLRLGDRVSMRLSAGGGRRDEWRNTADYPMAWEAHAMAAMSIQLAPQTVLSLEGTWARSVATEITPQQFTTASDHKANSFMATINSDTPYGEMQAQAYVNNNGELGYPGPLPPYNFKSQLSVVSLQDLFKIGTRNTIRLALEYRNSQQNTSPVDVGRVSYDVIAPSAMWDFAPTSRLSLNLAVRMDHMVLKRTGPAPPFVLYPNSDWDRSIDSFSANLGAVYRLDDLNTLRATYARGIQPPSLVELGGLQAVIVPGFLSLAGNPRLNPAVISNYQLSYDRSIPALNAKASAKAFFQQTDDIKGASDLTNPVFGPPGVGLVGGSENAANSTMAGFELAASGKIGGGFHWSADTTYTHVQERAINGNVLLTRNIQFDKTTPKFRGNIAAGWSGGRWAADAYVHYVTAYDAVVDPSGALLTTPAYVSLSGRISYRLSDGLTVALNGQNLGAARQLQGRVTGLQAPRRVMISLTKSW